MTFWSSVAVALCSRSVNLLDHAPVMGNGENDDMNKLTRTRGYLQSFDSKFNGIDVPIGWV